LGVILKGKTNHADNLSRSVTDALQRIALDYGVPVINCVHTFANELDARERCLEEKINRGTEAARAAIEIANVMSDLPTRPKQSSLRKNSVGRNRGVSSTGFSTESGKN